MTQAMPNHQQREFFGQVMLEEKICLLHLQKN